MLKRNAAILMVAGLVLGGGAIALAQGGPERPTTQANAQQAQPDREARRQGLRDCLQRAGQDEEARRRCRAQFGKGPGGGHGVLGRAVHGDLIVRGEDGTFQNVTLDKGTVNQSTDGNKIVLDRADGKQVTLQLTAETRYRGVQNAAQLRKGEPAMVTSRDGKALVVGQRPPGAPGPPGPGRGGSPPPGPRS